MKEWISDKAVYRTAPATPGLLIIALRVNLPVFITIFYVCKPKKMIFDLKKKTKKHALRFLAAKKQVGIF